MTSWQTFTITEIEKNSYLARLVFHLDRTFDDGDKRILTHYGEPHDTWRVGDIIEVDVDNYKKQLLYNSSKYKAHYVTESDNVVRKISSSVVVPGNSNSGQMSLSQEQTAFADRLVDRVEQSGGQYELDAYIQQGTEPHGTPYTRQGWVYRKKS